MKYRLSIAFIVMAALPGWAQQGPPRNNPIIVEVKYADVNRLANLLGNLYGATIRADPTLHVLAISGDTDTVAALTAAIKKLDVPPQPQPDVELTVYLISGLAQGQGADEIPQDLASTIKQLRGLFAYKSYKLADTLVLRGRAVPRGENSFGGQRTEASGALPGTFDLHYYFSYSSLNVSTENPRTVHVNLLKFSISGPRRSEKKGDVTTDLTEAPANISTDLDLREGQKTVVGKSSVNSAGDALILVIVPRIMD